MPRPKTAERRRCVRACDNCRKRKEKCDGLSPCDVCKKRNRFDTCTYLFYGSDKRGCNHETVPVQPTENAPDYSDLNVNIESSSNISRDINTEEELTEAADHASSTSAPVSKLSRLLVDGNGKPIYIGDSASVSFLQTIRRMVHSSIGPCSFTMDKLRHLLIEATPKKKNDPSYGIEPILEASEILELVRQFFLATSGALDLFDTTSIIERIPLWMEDRSRNEWPDSAIFYLLLAIGAQSRAYGRSDEHVAHYYFNLGHQQATNDLLDDLSVLTVQAFLMVTWYLITLCRRNRATISLGIAAQTAYVLGIHKMEANIQFGKTESISRERAWKSLRVCDLFLTASMGRPSITSNIDCDGPPLSSLSPNDNEDSSFGERMSSAMVRICYIFERILLEVYPKRAISLELAASISKQHREWTVDLPEMLKIDGLSQAEHHSATDLTPFLGSAVVVMAYYYSIILLTRPFLTFRVNCHIKMEKGWHEGIGQSAEVTTYADACVDSAIKGIGIAHDLLQYDGIPGRLPLIINSVFISALSLGLAYFGDYDSNGWLLEKGLTQATTILGHFGVHNPQSARHHEIIGSLWNAALKYKRQRDDNKSQFRSQLVSDVFGNAIAQVESQRPAAGLSKSPLDSERGFNMSASDNVELGRQPSFRDTESLAKGDFHALLQSSMITTSGGLTSMNQEVYLHSQFPGDHGDGNGFFMGTSPVASPSFSFGDEVSLFSTMNDFHVQGQPDWQSLGT